MNPATIDPDHLTWSPQQAADAIGAARQTLAKWRCEGRGPKYARVGRSIRYRPADVHQWLAEQVVDPTTGGAA